MSKYQKAIDKLYDINYRKSLPFDEISEEIHILKELADKEDAKAVKVKEYNFSGDIEYGHFCPRCHHALSYHMHSKRCDDCGQVLDWSEIDGV